MPTKKATPPADLLRQLPQVDKLLKHPDFERLLELFPRQEVVRALREAIGTVRQDMRAGEAPTEEVRALAAKLQPASMAAAAGERLKERDRPRYGRVVNATGVILHTGLGRAVLPRAVVSAVTEALGGYTLVEVDPVTGERGRRDLHVADLLCELTGAESATVVNNNAAATLITLATLARGREVIISRGQLVEIGGSYRIPNILAESGGRLVEVGTTNRTYVDDYRAAITPETGLILQVHTSNYEIVGFAHHTALEDLVALGREQGVPVVSDLGSGCLVDLTGHGVRREPLVQEAVRTGADLVCFSGDKLLGGPQAGIIVGRKPHVDAVRRHPLFRAMRVDKIALAALEATLKLYRDRDRLWENVPVLQMLSTPEKTIRRRAERFRKQVLDEVPGAGAETIEEASQSGSGSAPAQDIPTAAVALELGNRSAHGLAAALRANEPPIFARIQNERVLIDFRTLLPGEAKWILEALQRIAGGD